MLSKITFEEEELLGDGYRILSDDYMVGLIGRVMKEPDVWNVYKEVPLGVSVVGSFTNKENAMEFSETYFREIV